MTAGRNRHSRDRTRKMQQARRKQERLATKRAQRDRRLQQRARQRALAARNKGDAP